MKKISSTILQLTAWLLCLLLGAFSLFPKVEQANAPLCVAENAEQKQSFSSTTSYACILTDSFFYSAPDERYGLFLLPKTYYVRVSEYGAEYCKIEYLYDATNTRKITGYAKTDTLTFVDYIPLRPYLYYVFTLKYTIGDTQFEDSSFLTQITTECTYYGDYKIGSKIYCYVLRGDTFGYVPKPETLSFEENTEYADRLSSSNNSQESSSSATSSTNSPTQIAILVALCLLVPILAAFIVRPPKRPPYESND